MKALTILQPWAALICLPEGHPRAKRVENRGWSPTSLALPLRIAIHAGQSRAKLLQDAFGQYGLDAEQVPYGALVATARLVECFRPGGFRMRASGVSLTVNGQRTEAKRMDVNRLTIPLDVHQRHPWLATHEHVAGPCCWVLADVAPLAQPIPYRGRQGFFNVPDDVLQEAAKHG